MKAIPPWGHIYLRFRDGDYGRWPLPGLEIEHAGQVCSFRSITAALTHIRKLHDANLKGTQ